MILACLKLMTYASFSTKQLLAVLMDGNPCTNGWNSMHQNRKNVIASCFFEQSCLRQVKIQDKHKFMVKRNAIATKLTKRCTQTQKRAFDVAVMGLQDPCVKSILPYGMTFGSSKSILPVDFLLEDH